MGRRANSPYPCGLSRVDHERSGVHLWRVQVPGGKFLYFGDTTYGGRDAALVAALARLVLTPVLGVAAKGHVDSTTGVVGVCPIHEKGCLVAYKAHVGSRNHMRFRVFRLADYGERALDEAIRAREELLAEREREKTIERNEQAAALLRRVLSLKSRRK